MADKNIGKITQVIGAVLDLKFSEGYLPEINDAVEITRKDGGKLVVEVAQHLGDDIVRCIAMGPTDGLVRGMDAVLGNSYGLSPAEVIIIVYGRFSALSTFGGYQNYTKGCTRTIDRSGCGIFQDRDIFNILWIDGVDVSFHAVNQH